VPIELNVQIELPSRSSAGTSWTRRRDVLALVELAGVALAGVTLAGCAATPSAATPPPATSPPPNALPATVVTPHPSVSSSTPPSAQRCVARSRGFFVRVTYAEVAKDGVRVHGPLEAFVCEGPDDAHFTDGAAEVTIRLAPGAGVTVIPTGPNGPTQRDIPPADLPHYISSGNGSGIFEVSGSAGAATALTEQYRP
jgi:hypothetical protein